MGVKGNSGGKKGRSGRKSKAAELGLAEILEKAFPPESRIAVFENLARIAKGDNTSAVTAASLLLAYSFGKPTEKHEHSGEGGGPVQIQITYTDKQK